MLANILIGAVVFVLGLLAVGRPVSRRRIEAMAAMTAGSVFYDVFFPVKDLNLLGLFLSNGLAGILVGALFFRWLRWD